MGLINPSLPIVGQPITTDEPKISSALTAIVNEFNGNIEQANIRTDGITNLADKLAVGEEEKLGLSSSSQVRRGKSLIPTQESRTNVAYGLMPTPDRVQSVVLPFDGLICIAYQALVKTLDFGVNNTGRAAIFIGGNQVKIQNGSDIPTISEVSFPAVGGNYVALATSPFGLSVTGGGVGAGSHVTTGQLVAAGLGGVAALFAAAGTYDVSIQFREINGNSVAVMERKLWVWTMGF